MFGTFASIATAIFIEAMPFLVIASLFSALIEVFVATERLLRWLPKSVPGGLIAGILGGFLIPTCECGVVPIVRRLMLKGVPPFIAVAFMLAAPVVNPIVLASTYLAFRGSVAMVVARVAVAALVALVVALYVKRLTEVLADNVTDAGHDHDHDHSNQPLSEKIRAVLSHTAAEFMYMGRFLVIGCLAAAAFKTLLPEDGMSVFTDNAALSIAGMMLLAILLCVCSEADAFVAASFQTFTAGARLAFITVGPVVDLKLIGMFFATFRKRVVLALVVIPILLVFVLSWLIEYSGWLSGVLQ